MTGPIEPTSLFATARTDGLKVRSRDGDKLGHIDAFMIEKQTAAVSYAVLSLGGLLGIGKSYYPVPMNLLSYDSTEDGYIVTADRRLLEGGPSWAANTPDFTRAYADRVSSYYQTGAVPSGAA